MNIKTVTAAYLLIAISPSTFAGLIDVSELSLFHYNETLDTTLEQNEIGFEYSDFPDTSLTLDFSNNLNDQNLGTFSWRLTNTGPESLFNLRTAAFLDADIDQHRYSFTNETGWYVGNTSADAWEIDEPGYVSGDLLDNLYNDVQLDNSNALDGLFDDVSLSLAFYLDQLHSDEYIDLIFEISEENIGGLYHYDPDSDYGFFFNGEMFYNADPTGAYPSVPVPEPATPLLVATGLLALGLRRAKTRTPKE